MVIRLLIVAAVGVLAWALGKNRWVRRVGIGLLLLALILAGGLVFLTGC